MNTPRRTKTMYTKEHFKGVITLWENKSKEEIAVELGLNYNQVTYLANQIKKAGYELPAKHKIGRTQALAKELLTEMKLI